MTQGLSLYSGLTVLNRYTRWVLKPQLGNLTFVDARVPSTPGFFDISINATSYSFSLKLLAPLNTSGQVCVPAMGLPGSIVTVDGQAITGTASGDYFCVDDLLGGKMHMISRA